MTNEEKILQRLERLEEKITPVAESAAALNELKKELTPRVNEAVQALIVEMADIEADFQMESLVHLIKKIMRNVNNFNFALDMMHNLIDLTKNAEPLLKTTIPQVISFLDELEQKNVFKVLNAGIDVMKDIAQKYSSKEIEQISQGFCKLANTISNLTAPEAVDLIEKASKIPAAINLGDSKPAGAVSMLMAMNDPSVKKGLGVLLELTRGLAALKDDKV